ncbi:hypothetical protein MMC32_007433 [Xylographa parallela]|nr:hypothetical protein [Xylographa parallela]
MSSQWSRLPVIHVSPLLVKHDISSSAYTIQITDLTHIWTESLDRRQIIRRALDENISIDPSEGPSQLMKLLQEIEKALKGQPDTSLKIQYLAQHESITLEATVVLPNPLPHLIWCFRLSCASQELLTSNLLLPCLSELLHARLEAASLLTHIKEKDHVISRLTEKLEASGVDLTTVFPSAAPSRRSKTNARELVLASVKGLNEFNIHNWRNEVKTSTGDTDIEILCNQVFGTGSSTVYDAPNGPYGDLGTDKLEGKSSAIPEIDMNQSPLPLRGSQNNVEDFQVSDPWRTTRTIVDQMKRQITPVQESDAAAKPGSARQYGQRAISDSTISGSETSDDDLEGPTTQKHENTKSKPVLMSNSPKKLGMLGGKKQHDQLLPAQIALSPNVPGEGESPERTTGQLEDNMARLATIDKPRPKLGRIGGLHKEGKLPEREPSAQMLLSSAKMTGEGPSTVVEHEGSRRQAMKESASPPPARETSQERADRNRARLKRELEAKNKAPVKKKRKF